MEKIGVITVHKNVNYGANLQAFASCKYLNKQGYDCSLIDYTIPAHEKSTRLFSWLKQSWDGEQNKSFSRKIKLAAALALSFPWKQKRLKAFDDFRKKYIKMTPYCKDLQDVVKLNLDTVVCGSDQIWNPTIMGGIVPLYFSDVIGVKKKISYAASVGKDKLESDDEKKMKELVLALDDCSVREEQTAEYISALTGRKVETVCDPVFLLEKADYEEVAKKRLFKNEYILLYSVVHNDELTKIAKDYADRKGIELIEICAAKDKGATHRQISDFGPCEFLSAFQHAKTVFTNSFHGTAFSLIFEKDFYIVDNKVGASRIVNLLEKAGLTERLICESVKEDFSAIDYTEHSRLLQEYVQHSKNFLDKALQSKKEFLAGDACTGCAACNAVCKVGAIKLIKNREGFLTAVVDRTKCIDCGLCKKTCPAMNKQQASQNAPIVYAFKALDELRKNSTSGGAFAALATTVCKDGGTFYGASQQADFSVGHLRGETETDLKLMQGTKYLPSDISSCYKKIEEDLKGGRLVLFSGTPCQVAGILQFVELKKLSKENLYTVDIICHGVPSPAFYQAYMDWLEKEKGSKVLTYKFRSKELSWRGSSCYAELKNGAVLKNEKQLCAFMNIYYSGNITRESCCACPYASQKRISDLTISDYWGIEKLDESFEDALGVSMVLVNTERGRLLFEKTEGQRIEGDIQTAKQPQLSEPALRPQTREEFWKEYEEKGVKPLLKKYGGLAPDSFKTFLYKIKKKIFK